jgi:YbgC/YbaW family acyl-CoA thioester hydrolase
MSSKVFAYPLIIKEHHLDTFGHVNNAVYLEIFEEARWELVTVGGYGLKKVQETGQGPTILEVNLKFQRELKLRDKITIRTTMGEIKGKIFQIKQWIEKEDGSNACEALFTVAMFDLKLRKIIPISQEWLDATGYLTP